MQRHAAVCEVLLDQNVRAGIVVDSYFVSPARPDVVHHVVPDARPRADSLGVDPTHVDHLALADVMDMIVLHHVAEGVAFLEIHRPPHQYARVMAVIYVVVDDLVPGTVHHTNPVRRQEDHAGVGDLVVGHGGAGTVEPDLDAAGAQVAHPVSRDLHVSATLAHLDSIGTTVFDDATGESALARVRQPDRPRYVIPGARVVVPLPRPVRRFHPLRMREGEALEPQ